MVNDQRLRSTSTLMENTFLVQCRATHNVEAAEPATRPFPATLEVWRSADAVCFDVDSTVSLDEGIDELAAFCGAGEAVAAWTARAMVGSVPFEEALAARLALFKPSSSTVSEYLSKNPPRLTPGIVDLVSALHTRGIDVYLVSGGFRQMIEPIAALLSIPTNKIFANRLLFHPDGQFSGVDLNEPTCRSGGKAEAIARIKLEHGYSKLVMIGDGATDLEARKPGGADIFICYGGVQHRELVAAEADWFVVRFKDLIDNLRPN